MIQAAETVSYTHLQEQENKMETLFIPYVEEVDQKPAVTKYYVWKRGEAEGTVSYTHLDVYKRQPLVMIR